MWAPLLASPVSGFPGMSFQFSISLHHHPTQLSKVLLIVAYQLLSSFSHFCTFFLFLLISPPPSFGRVASKHASYPLFLENSKRCLKM
jgi:hypothetical protein